MTFHLYPAIDLRDGACVRLIQGDYDREIRYESDPVEVALSFEEAGAQWIHVVDLDAARSGQPENLATVSEIVRKVTVPVQTGGGVRSLETAKSLFDVGINRCVMGTAAVENPALIEMVADLGFSVALGLDVRGTEVATRGWEQDSGWTIFELLARFENAGAEAIVVTQINRDGMGTGSDIEGLSQVLASTGLEVVASGGVGSLQHIADLLEVEVDGRFLSGVIVGKAIHDGKIDVAEAIETIRAQQS